LNTTTEFTLRPKKTGENLDITVQLQDFSDSEGLLNNNPAFNRANLASVPTAHAVAGLKILTNVFS
jgi:hypothetical protein